ncbi:MAG: DNA primase, partial [Methylobacteriaceae bacterium]|nr:DNA primase [Methylobacteriaceae bacterium]
MPDTASELARRLARDAEAVCRHYLSNGRREGRYWLVGDVENSPGRSLYVRLRGPESGKGAAGKWTDAADARHGDLLDLIAANQHLTELRDVLDEARRFLSLPSPERRDELAPPAPTSSPEAARRLWAISTAVRGTVAEAYLRTRGITDLRDCASLRFHPRCWYRPDRDDDPQVRTAWPALIAAVADHSGTITGVQRTWLDPSVSDKAPIVTPRRAMGD